MKNRTDSFFANQLPLRRDLKPASILAIAALILMTAASLGSLMFPSTIYPTDEMKQAFLTNDLVNLLIGLPVLLISFWLTRRGNLVGLLCLPGALLYITYNYLAYLFGLPFGGITILYLVLVVLSIWSVIALLKRIDTITVQKNLTGKVPVKTSGWVLLLFGIAFAFRAIGFLFQADSLNIQISEIGVLIADLTISMLWMIGGVFLLRRKPFGYLSGLGLLVTGSELFIGLILFLILQPILTGSPFAIIDVIVVFIMGLVCFIPTGFFMRSVSTKRTSV